MIINVLEYLEASSKTYPDKIAFEDSDNRISYKELVNQAQAIGSNLIPILNSETKSPVAVVIDRDIFSLISFFGVVYSGNFYVPIDVQLPISRIELMINTLQPKIIICPQKALTVLKDLDFQGRIVVFDDVLLSPINETELNIVRANAIDTDPLYAIFTSGSTGTPKGALICHRSVIDLVEQFTKVFGFSSDCIFGNQAPFDFDVSVKDIYLTIKLGASLQIIPKKFFSFPGELIKFINEKKISIAIWATSVLRIFENLKALSKEKPQYLEKILFSGEVMPNKVLNYWRQALPEILYVNLYGPTEITCNCTYYIVDRTFSDTDMLPIGVPFPNTEILLLNELNQLVTEYEIGEICVRGSSLALGYYNNTSTTSNAFVNNPLNPHYPEIIYRTGDLGKYNENHELLILARKDYQIKHMGHRIELGEIELAVNALHFIDVSCCLHDPSTDKIHLFYQSQSSCDKEILTSLRDFLPKYMLPNKLIHVQKMPMTKNSKIDRIGLRNEYIDG